MSDADTNTDENDPEIQRNGFRAYEDEFTLPPKLIETFLEKLFVPDDAFEKNNRRFWNWLGNAADDVVLDCPECGQQGEGAEIRKGVAVMVPCGHELGEPDRIEG